MKKTEPTKDTEAPEIKDETPEISAATILKESKDAEEKTSPEESAEDPEAEVAAPIIEDEKADESKDEEPEKLADLDPEIAKDPDLKKRWDEHKKGVDKIVERVKGKEKVLDAWMQVADAFESPNTAWQMLETLEKNAVKAYGPRPGASKKEDPAPEVDPSEWKKQGFDSEEDYQQTMAFVMRAVKTATAPLQSEIERLKQDQGQEKEAKQKADTQSKYEAQLSKIITPTITYIEKANGGWKVTEKMVRDAVKEFPQLAKEPYKAVYAKYSDDRANHAAGRSVKNGKKPPDMVPAGRNPGQRIETDPDKLTAAMILAERA